MASPVLTVSTKGLSKLTSRNGLNWIPTELIQNAWDQQVSKVTMTIESIGHGKGRITIVDDDPDGFLDLSHAYTLFAESNKKGNATLRGRFNMGEKLVIAHCIETGGSVEILTTTGGYSFSKEGGRKRLRRKTEEGSKVTAEFRASKEVLAMMTEHVHTFVAPSGFVTTVNGEELLTRDSLSEFEESMPTVVVNDEGDLIRTSRKTTIEVYETLDGETPMIYELGIPVVENPTKYHINVKQKVPLNMERDSVTPAYSRKLCALVLNATRDLLTKEEASQAWVAEAMESDFIEAESVSRVLDQKHGKKRVMHDPTNPAASAAAAAQGYAVVYGGSWSKKAHDTIRNNKPVTSATTKFKDAGVDFAADGKDVTIPRDKWTEDMRNLSEYAEKLHTLVHNTTCHVNWVSDPRGYSACYGGGTVLLNKRRLGKRWPTQAVSTRRGFEKYLDLIIHEFAHKHANSHYDLDFSKGCTRIGAAIAVHLSDAGLPEWFNGGKK
tara:strand:+ start:7066 stop:8550 length:1485 start_codon:yes stop_codon:yes gene_type:complete